MNRTGVIIGLHTSPGGIPKFPLDSVRVDLNGLDGDGHNHACHRTPKQAVCLIDQEMIESLASEGFDVSPGAMGENVTLQGMMAQSLSIGDRLIFSGGLEIELTKLRRPCYVLDSIHRELKTAAVGRIGWYASVVRPGLLRVGERVEVLQHVGSEDDRSDA